MDEEEHVFYFIFFVYSNIFLREEYSILKAKEWQMLCFSHGYC